MSTQWEIDNIWFTGIKLKLLCSIYLSTPIKSKIGGKIFSQKICQSKLLSPLFNSVKFSLRLKNKWVALVAFKLSVALNIWKRKAWFIKKHNLKRVSFKVISEAKLSTDHLMAYSPEFNCRGGPFKKLRKKSYHFNSFKQITKTRTFSWMLNHLIY